VLGLVLGLVLLVLVVLVLFGEHRHMWHKQVGVQCWDKLVVPWNDCRIKQWIETCREALREATCNILLFCCTLLELILCELRLLLVHKP
jgi:hypothetical protein